MLSHRWPRAVEAFVWSTALARRWWLGLYNNVRVGVIKVSVPGCKIELFEKDSFQSYIENERDWMKNIITSSHLLAAQQMTSCISIPKVPENSAADMVK